MNTSGVQRGYMAKNMRVEEFLNVVVKAISMEFEKEVKVENIGEGQIRIVIDSYEVRTSMNYLEEIKSHMVLIDLFLKALRRRALVLIEIEVNIFNIVLGFILGETKNNWKMLYYY